MNQKQTQRAIAAQLAALLELYAHQDALRIEHQTLVSDAIPDRIQIVVADIDLEYKEQYEALWKKTAALEKTIKTAVVAHGATIKTHGIQAVYSKGRMRWDSRGLAGYAVAHPEVGAFHTVGKPSVSLRRTR